MATLHPREVVHTLSREVLRAASGQLQDDATVLCVDWYGPQTGGVYRSPAPAPVRVGRHTADGATCPMGGKETPEGPISQAIGDQPPFGPIERLDHDRLVAEQQASLASPRRGTR